MKKSSYKIILLICGILVSTAYAANPETSTRQSNLAREAWGYVDQTGKVVIEPKFVRAFPFQHGIAECFDYSATTGEPDWKTLIYIDKSGHQYKQPSNGYGHNRTQDNFYDKFEVDNHPIVQDNFLSVWSSRGDLVLLKRAYDFSVGNPSQGTVQKIPLDWHQQGENPKSGNYWCKVGDQAYEFTGAVGKSPVQGFQPVSMPKSFASKYDYYDLFSEGLAAVMKKDGHWSYINSDGEVQINLPANCSNAQPFSEGLAAVSIGGKPWAEHYTYARISPYKGAKYGFIDKSGDFVIPPRFPCPPAPREFESKFVNGLALATAEKNGDTAFGYINKSGNFVVPAVYKDVTRYGDGLAAVNAGPVGFDRLKWLHKATGPFAGGRSEPFGNFLRQYDLIGMTRTKVVSLLGPPDDKSSSPGEPLYESYVLAGLFGSAETLLITYKNDVVAGYCIQERNPNQPARIPWVTKNAKPDLDQSLIDFCLKQSSFPAPNFNAPNQGQSHQIRPLLRP